jgi:hypothetical protein
MRPVSKVLLILCLFVLFVQACNEGTDGDKGKPNPIATLQDTVIKDIPLNIRDSAYRQMQRNTESKIGLSSLEGGFKDLQIRIWRGYSQTDFIDLILFTKVNDKWSARLHNLVLHYDKNFDSVVAITKKVVTKEPKSGWQFFTDSLIKLKILDLPDYSTLPDYYVSADSDGVTVEVATVDKYRTYSYPDFESYISKKTEAKKMYQILKLIENEFHFKWLRELKVLKVVKPT